MIAAGCDVGSLTAEAVILDDGRILAAEIIRVRPRPEQSAREVMDLALARAGLSYSDLGYTVSTGYGRETISFADHNISEISCHGRGAHHLVPGVRTVIDIGGQDCKAIRVDAGGFLEDFVMNDKCAAGTGRSLELMSQYLGVHYSELAGLAAQAERVITITSQCSIFSELEIMHYLMEDQPRISDGGHLAELARRYPEAKLICAHLCGGGDWEWTIKTLRHAKSVFLDTSGSVVDEGMVEMAVKVLGADRLLFGADMSFTAGVGKIRGARLTDEERGRILGGNMLRVLQRRGGSR